MKHYKKDGKIIVELSPLELMTKFNMVWKVLPSDIRRQIFGAPFSVIRLINDGGKFSLEYEA